MSTAPSRNPRSGKRAAAPTPKGTRAGHHNRQLGDLPRAAELMQVLVDYERELGHPDAEKHAAELATLRACIKNPPASTEPDA